MKERRKVERFIPMLEPKGRCWLYVDDLCLDVFAVQDISPFGIKVQVDSAIDDGVAVRLIYKDKDMNLMVNGSIVWSMVLEDEEKDNEVSQSFLVAIYLEPHEMESNLHFFYTMTDQ